MDGDPARAAIIALILPIGMSLVRSVDDERECVSSANCTRFTGLSTRRASGEPVRGLWLNG